MRRTLVVLLLVAVGGAFVPAAAQTPNVKVHIDFRQTARVSILAARRRIIGGAP